METVGQEALRTEAREFAGLKTLGLKGLGWTLGGDLFPFQNLETILIDGDAAMATQIWFSFVDEAQPFLSSLKEIRLYSNFKFTGQEGSLESGVFLGHHPEDLLAGMISVIPTHPSLKTIYSPKIPVDNFGHLRLSASEDRAWLDAREKLKKVCSEKNLELVFMDEDEMKGE